jgi:hypothetical protein
MLKRLAIFLTAFVKEQLDTARQKERPKLRIELEDVKLNLADSPEMVLVDCKIRNYDGSVEFIIANLCGCWIGETAESEERQRPAFSMNLPAVLGLSDNPLEPTIVLADEDRVVDVTLWNRDDPRIESVRRGEKSIYVSGFVMYKNIFDKTWTLGFKETYTVQILGHGLTAGRWSREGDADNYERKELPKEKAEPPSPN